MGNIIDSWRAMIAQSIVEGGPFENVVLQKSWLEKALAGTGTPPTMPNSPRQEALDLYESIPTAIGGSIRYDINGKPIKANQLSQDYAMNYNNTVVVDSQRKADEDYARQQQFVNEKNYNVGVFNAAATGQRPSSFMMSTEEGVALGDLGLGMSDEGYSISLRNPMPPPKYDPKVIKSMAIPADQWFAQKRTVSASKPKPGGGGGGPKTTWVEPLVYHMEPGQLQPTPSTNYSNPLDVWLAEDYQNIPGVLKSQWQHYYNNGTPANDIWRMPNTSNINYGFEDLQQTVTKTNNGVTTKKTLKQMYDGKDLTMMQKFAVFVANALLKARNGAPLNAYERDLKAMSDLFYPGDERNQTKNGEARILELDRSNFKDGSSRLQKFLKTYYPESTVDAKTGIVTFSGKKNVNQLNSDILTPLANLALEFIDNNISIVGGNKFTQQWGGKSMVQNSVKAGTAKLLSMQLVMDILNGIWSPM